MKDFNKEEYNKMCAEFLGWQYNSEQSIHFPKGTYKDLEKVGHCAEKGLRFEIDWNWIMEVVNKIKPIVSMSKTRPLKDYNTNFRYALISAKKEEIVQAIWEFINWHKENKK
jgi:hypothetical protein